MELQTVVNESLLQRIFCHRLKKAKRNTCIIGLIELFLGVFLLVLHDPVQGLLTGYAGILFVTLGLIMLVSVYKSRRSVLAARAQKSYAQDPNKVITYSLGTEEITITMQSDLTRQSLGYRYEYVKEIGRIDDTIGYFITLNDLIFPMENQNGIEGMLTLLQSKCGRKS